MTETAGLTLSSLSIGSNFIPLDKTWTELKAIVSSKVLSLQHEEDAEKYTLFTVDSYVLVYTAIIYKGTVPDWAIGDYSQVQNDADLLDFETNYESVSNMPLVPMSFGDPRKVSRFGNLTASSASEVLVYPRTYAEPASQAQRSVVSTSASDSDSGASGGRVVRIIFLNSSYVLKTEDVIVDGTTPVNTVATDIRFIESMQVIKGTFAVGAIKLMTATAGGGTEICGVAAASTDSNFCHHYVPAGKKAYVQGWGATVSDEASMKLFGQDRLDGVNLVDRVYDLDSIIGVAAGTRTTFYRPMNYVVPEKTYVRVKVVPNQATSTIIRAYLDLWEMKI